VLIPGIAGRVTAAVLIGVGVGLITPVGFAYLAATAPEERLGQTMSAAEVGRELGDAGGPLLVGAWLRPSPLTPRCCFSADYSPPLPVSSPHPTAGPGSVLHGSGHLIADHCHRGTGVTERAGIAGCSMEGLSDKRWI
jgi:hypothetical protein